jgi:hypothetical protein
VTVLPVGARRMYLRRFGKPTRRVEWAATQPSILGARISGQLAMQQFEEFDIPQTSEVLLVEAGMLGTMTHDRTMVVHDGVTVEVVSGPHPLSTDRSWEYFHINGRQR